MLESERFSGLSVLWCLVGGLAPGSGSHRNRPLTTERGAHNMKGDSNDSDGGRATYGLGLVGTHCIESLFSVLKVHR